MIQGKYTPEEKQLVKDLISRGFTHQQIADTMNRHIFSVRTFCSKNKISKEGKSLAGRKKGSTKLTFDKKLAEIIKNLAADGKNQTEISEILGISRQTFWCYKQNEQIGEALEEGRNIADELVERSLFSRATGMEYKEQMASKDKDGNIQVRKIDKFLPPDVAACKFWLTNRRSRNWKEKQHTEHSGEVKSLHAQVVDALQEKEKQIE